ncbi:Rossmann-like and DUF2520 domain-containing protein [Plebeiibacterium sediminum]|uniref:DUF2520 domain-containing protein n=1 Tax=Plebeiibacterium sediminum TaxID=2992112 RepID=A0AAE3M9E2_9BACT|nr:DUF2520 domain-containing protein [Plebeiobacterium sediminum]MCW3789025.1 DUF2520 domain-containing protein [Plebeiobacterium sediminum]
MIRNIVLIGAGNLATQFGYSLAKKGFNIRQVYSFTIKNAEILAEKLNAYYTDNLDEIQLDADLYIIAVKDAFLAETIEKLPVVKGIVTHTAGSHHLDMLLKFDNYGIIYPFQTFSKDKEVDFNTIPILVEANNKQTENDLLEFGHKVSQTVMTCDSDQRKQIHLAAVFACNFTNHMYAIADEILKKHDISFDVIKPLILETASKIDVLSPLEAQTGPAIRGDQNIIDNHLKMLSDESELASIYKTLSKRIMTNIE